MIYDVCHPVAIYQLTRGIETPIYYVAYILLAFPSIAHRNREYLKGAKCWTRTS